MSFQTEFEFELPRGYVDQNGEVHKRGVMRLATAAEGPARSAESGVPDGDTAFPRGYEAGNIAGDKQPRNREPVHHRHGVSAGSLPAHKHAGGTGVQGRLPALQ